MTEQTAPYYQSTEEPPSRWAAGFIAFAGIMMILAGGFQILAGLVALFENEFYVTTRNYLLKFDATSWGWIHLLLGLLVLFAGFAVLSALSMFAFVPYYPFWALAVITLDVFVIWALIAHGRDLAR
jgi:hypothetical protein